MNLTYAQQTVAEAYAGIDPWEKFSKYTQGPVDVVKKTKARDQGLENPNLTEILTYTSRRENLVNDLISAAIRYNLDGINVDFESVDPAVGDAYIQFIRELSLKCANK